MISWLLQRARTKGAVSVIDKLNDAKNLSAAEREALMNAAKKEIHPSIVRSVVEKHPVKTVVGAGVLATGTVVAADVAFNDADLTKGAAKAAVGGAADAATDAVEYVTDVAVEKGKEALLGPDDNTGQNSAGANNDKNSGLGELLEAGMNALGIETNDENGNDKAWVSTVKDVVPGLLGMGLAGGTAYFSSGWLKWASLAATVLLGVNSGKKLMHAFNEAADPNGAPAPKPENTYTGGPAMAGPQPQ